MEDEFKKWMKEVESIIKLKTGLSIHDIPDNTYYLNYEDEYTPQEMAKIVIDDLEQETNILIDILKTELKTSK